MMDAPSWLSLLLLVVPSLAAVRQLVLVHQRMSWSAAQTYCREKHHLDLATVANQNDWVTVSGMVANWATREPWIGLYDDVTNWRRSLDNTSLYPGGNPNLASWFPLHADNANGDEYCMVYRSGTFRDESCQGKAHSICYDEPSNSYPDFASSVLWSEGQKTCRERYTDLAGVRNKAELDAMKAAYGWSGQWWVGFYRTGWTWSDQSESSFRVWAEGQPSAGLKSCTYADVSGWANDDCSTERPFICSAAIAKVIKVALKAKGSIDPNDPQILASILEQRETLLREQGLIDQDAKLKWRERHRGVVFNKTEL